MSWFSGLMAAVRRLPSSRKMVLSGLESPTGSMALLMQLMR